MAGTRLTGWRGYAERVGDVEDVARLGDIRVRVGHRQLVSGLGHGRRKGHPSDAVVIDSPVENIAAAGHIDRIREECAAERRAAIARLHVAA